MMNRIALAAAVVALGLAGAAAPAAAASGGADPVAPLPEETLGEVADARNLLAALQDGGTPAATLAPAEAALECWADAGPDALRCRDAFFARVVDSAWQPPAAMTAALAQQASVDLWMD